VSCRPKVASQLTGRDLEQLFDVAASTEAVLTVLAGLAALPDDWQLALKNTTRPRDATSTSGSGTARCGRGRGRQDNGSWVSSFVTAVLKVRQGALPQGHLVHSVHRMREGGLPEWWLGGRWGFFFQAAS